MMRSIAVFAAAFPLLARGAVSSGALEVSGGSAISFESSSSKADGAPDSVDTKTFELDLTGLYYLTPNLGVGAFANLSNETQEVGSSKNGLTTILVGPGLGVDFPVQQQLSLFAQGGVGWARARITETGSPDVNFSGWALVVRGGLRYFVVKSFSIDGAVQYSRVQLTGDAPPGGGPKPEVTTNGLGLALGLSVFFG